MSTPKNYIKISIDEKNDRRDNVTANENCSRNRIKKGIFVLIGICVVFAFANNAMGHPAKENDESSSEIPPIENDIASTTQIIPTVPLLTDSSGSEKPPDKVTFVLFAADRIGFDGSVEVDHSSRTFSKLKEKSKIESSHFKKLLSIGGRSNTQFLPLVIADPRRKRRFFKSIISILEEYQLDGVDLLWKWAKNSNTKKCSRFLCELKQKLKERKKNYVLSVQILPDEPSSWELFNPANGSPLNIQVEDCNTGPDTEVVEPSDSELESTENNSKKLTVDIFKFCYITSDGNLQFEDEIAMKLFLKLKEQARSENLKLELIFKIDGRTNTFLFSSVILAHDKKRKFINSVISFLKEYRLGNSDLIWKSTRSSFRVEYFRFLDEFKSEIKERKRNYILSKVVRPPLGFSL
ncbi:GH18 domain-containing protein [Caenorhabditis elegans]|uniref:GH18 domain-containing protein n=1 Tax=Caenorhabditis elegans TaxID=6239 RepID=Q22597_CAEEL|nr:GH18 domain-containing protein [Caenorhabditis elegans]CAA87664.1 GH18 domain-containing protein [Caenorhabditis elegans]|eukprot:NP_496035.1 CHItinase-Like [Caenorhabditis elegans]